MCRVPLPVWLSVDIIIIFMTIPTIIVVVIIVVVLVVIDNLSEFGGHEDLCKYKTN